MNSKIITIEWKGKKCHVNMAMPDKRINIEFGISWGKQWVAHVADEWGIDRVVRDISKRVPTFTTTNGNTIKQMLLIMLANNS